MDDFNFIVYCKTQKELNAVLGKAESEGYKWASGKDPTKITLYAPMYIHIHPDDRHLLYGETILTWHEPFVISANRYLNDENAVNENIIASGISQKIKDQIVKEFLEKWLKMRKCADRNCKKCVFSSNNTEHKCSFCIPPQIDELNINELIQIINTGEVLSKSRMTTTKALKILDDITTFGIENISSEDMPNFSEALKLAIEVLKEKEDLESE